MRNVHRCHDVQKCRGREPFSSCEGILLIWEAHKETLRFLSFLSPPSQVPGGCQEKGQSWLLSSDLVTHAGSPSYLLPKRAAPFPVGWGLQVHAEGHSSNSLPPDTEFSVVASEFLDRSGTGATLYLGSWSVARRPWSHVSKTNIPSRRKRNGVWKALTHFLPLSSTAWACAWLYRWLAGADISLGRLRQAWRQKP